MVMFPKAMVTAYYGYDDFGFGFYDTENQKYIPAIEENSPYIEMLKFYNKLDVYKRQASTPASGGTYFPLHPPACRSDYSGSLQSFGPPDGSDTI